MLFDFVRQTSVGLDDYKEGVAMLYGTEENVFKHFEVDNSTLQFSKEKAVTLIIQLIAKSMGAAAPSPPSMPSGEHCSGGTTGPRSTPYPPPVPE
ncbi:hypothetical protein OS493_026728 [Desmophyllum pertusum]|uniref:Uncharacterized protein n=1 Tax=Desmophyllum pertusum TaxID=174260 RepID=A0A9W9ZZV4_9CNID|nr:hypothetical protein OS493_026728 [Desmophyllum pertusum]